MTSGPKPAALGVEVVDVFGLLGAVAVADAVEAGEVCAGLGGCADVVDRHRVFGVGQRDLGDLGAGLGALVYGLADNAHDLGIGPVDEVFLWKADAKPLERGAFERGGEVWHRLLGRCAVIRVATGENRHEERGVRDVLRHRSDLVE